VTRENSGLRKIVASGPTVTYERDAAHRLAAVRDGTTSVAYGYDTFDRISTRDTDDFAYPGAGIDPAADSVDLYARTQSHSLFAVENTNGWRFPLSDLHGDVVALIDTAGDLAGTSTYNPYGEIDNQTGEATGLGYQGDWHDVTAIRGNWTYGDNLAAVNRLTGQGVPLEEAVRQTWTAGQAARYGFTNATVVESAGSAGNYTTIRVLFGR
jgi:YD repeat-containing protein